MKVKIKKLVPEAVIPKYAKSGDAGLDLVATSRTFDNDGNVCYGTGLSFEIPTYCVGLLFPRSSNAKKDLLLSNSVGVLDSGYRGEVFFKFKPSLIFKKEKGQSKEYWQNIVNSDSTISSKETKLYKVGDRIGQIIILPYPKVEFEEVTNLSETERGDGGFGSSGE